MWCDGHYIVPRSRQTHRAAPAPSMLRWTSAARTAVHHSNQHTNIIFSPRCNINFWLVGATETSNFNKVNVTFRLLFSLTFVVIHLVQNEGTLIFFLISPVLVFQSSRFLTEIFLIFALIKCHKMALTATWMLLNSKLTEYSIINYYIRDCQPIREGRCHYSSCTSMIARVTDISGLSDPLPWHNSTKHGCILAPIFFNLFYAAMLLNAFHNCNHGIEMQYRTDDGIFNLCRLKSKLKITELLPTCDLSYSYMAHSLEDATAITDCFIPAATHFGLTVSICSESVK